MLRKDLNKFVLATTMLFLALFLLTVYNQHWMYNLDTYHRAKTYIRGKSLGGRYDVILNYCGELCDVTKPVEPGPFMGTVSAEVDCTALFHSDEIDRPSESDPVEWKDIPPFLQNEYSHFGKVEIKDLHMNDRGAGGGRKEVRTYTKEQIEEYIAAYKNGEPQGVSYVNASEIISQAADYIDIEDKTILVIGTQFPWLEAVLLTKSPKRIITVEYGLTKSEYPNFDFITPQVFRDMYRAGTLPQFDVIFTYSSVEHSGLGRYGDALNPWGDIITIARAWCVSSPNAKLAVGVPTGMKDIIEFNAHRIYGPVLYPYLVTNWKFIWSTSGDFKPGPDQIGWGHQPVYVFEKQSGYHK